MKTWRWNEKKKGWRN